MVQCSKMVFGPVRSKYYWSCKVLLMKYFVYRFFLLEIKGIVYQEYCIGYNSDYLMPKLIVHVRVP